MVDHGSSTTPELLGYAPPYTRFVHSPVRPMTIPDDVYQEELQARTDMVAAQMRAHTFDSTHDSSTIDTS